MIRLLAIAVSLAAFAAGSALMAQEREGYGEVSAMTGFTAGNIGTHVAVAGSAGANFTRYISGVLEAEVIPMSDRTLFPRVPGPVKGSDMFDFSFALHGGVPIKRWEPYGVFGVAVLVNAYKQGFINDSGGLVYTGQRHSKFGLVTGAGCRYYVGGRWGVRAEYRYTSSIQNFNQILGGVFYRVDGEGVFGFLPALARHFR